MEPRPSERGNGTQVDTQLIVIDASMEPRPSERGNILANITTGEKEVTLQWSHVRVNVETMITQMKGVNRPA